MKQMNFISLIRLSFAAIAFGLLGIPVKSNGQTHHIGENYGGGIIFYVYDNGQHGLIASMEDQSTASDWSPLYSEETRRLGAVGNGLGAGKGNTPIIISYYGYHDAPDPGSPYHYKSYAAQVAAAYSFPADNHNGNPVFGDWYLPSIWELEQMYTHRAVIGITNVRNRDYWSSTEVNKDEAYVKRFWTVEHRFGAIEGGDTRPNNKRSVNYVRAIRSF